MAKKQYSHEGIKVTLDDRIFEDFEFLNAVTAMDSIEDEKDAMEAVKGVNKIADLMLGKDKEKVLAKLRKKNNGYLPIMALVEFLTAIMNKSAKAKKS